MQRLLATFALVLMPMMIPAEDKAAKIDEPSGLQVALPSHTVDPLPETAALPAFNRMVLERLRQYPTDGTHGYWWPKAAERTGPYDGASRNVEMWGRTVLYGEKEGRTFCCGLTLEVFLDVWSAWVSANPDAASKLQPAQMTRFKSEWFVKELNGPGPSLALESTGLGRTIPHEEAVAGDFIQLWRTNNMGHSAVFLGWIRNDTGTIIGVNYWSTQDSTNGINERKEYFDDIPENRQECEREDTAMRCPLMVRDNVYFARVEPPVQSAPLRTPAGK